MTTTMKSAEELKEYERRFAQEVWNDRNYEMIAETHADDFVGHWFDPEREAVDREGLQAFVEAVHEGFSDFHWDVEFVLAEDDMAASGFTVSGTHDGEFMGIPPTDHEVSSPGILVHRFDEDGIVVESWGVWDALGHLQQLGVVPESFSLASFLETGANLAKQDILERTRSD